MFINNNSAFILKSLLVVFKEQNKRTVYYRIQHNIPTKRHITTKLETTCSGYGVMLISSLYKINILSRRVGPGHEKRTKQTSNEHTIQYGGSVLSLLLLVGLIISQSTYGEYHTCVTQWRVNLSSSSPP